MEARISSIVKDIITRMNLSTSTRDPKDSMKNVKLLQHGMLYRDICKNSMVDLPHSTRITMLLREFNRSDNYLGQSAPATEFRGQDLRTACEEMLSKQLCIPTKYDSMSAYSVGDLVYALNHHLNKQCTAAIITKLHDGDIYDVENGKDT
ncbi:unnamed protein product [Hymenolepis diminuta]|uniref:Uncharacterized protein n=1 Tax=Hymenolepis diminuta TaxID=6216 RepID=A0A564XZN6_HYMDI|nr:unnamed protein product [Hymenolepis diminuta]